MDESILNKIEMPQDLKEMSIEELEKLSSEIRKKVLEVVSKNGGHLASNLGIIELTVALHKVFDCPKDNIVWDVGHQCYAHKILTGRLNKIDTIRKEGGLSGFPKITESKFDTFSTGHSSTSISAAYGLARAKSILGDDSKVIAIIGDGALSGGIAYEALNNAGSFKKNFIVILNDNKMSISRNVGSMARYLLAMRTRSFYLKLKNSTDFVLSKIPLFGKVIKKMLLSSKSALKHLLYHGTIFENMGFMYCGPVDGHNIKKLVNILSVVKDIDKPILLHVNTVKGKGYKYAEKDPKVFHGISSFDVKTGGFKSGNENFSSVFGETLCKIAKENNKVCAITAAMKLGTGLSQFSKKYKSRFFDVGIAEEHAVTFAGGLAKGGMIPVFAVYSTFLQRSYDQIVEDAALQGFKMILAIDRAGIVGEDGETHQGIFDTAFLNTIPNVTIYAPSYFDELSYMLNDAVNNGEGVCAIRYPRGGEMYKPKGYIFDLEDFSVYGKQDSDIAIVTYGRIFSNASLAKEKLESKGIKTCIVKLNKIKPIKNEVIDYLSRFKKIYFFEEGILSGGIGEHLNSLLSQSGYRGEFKLTAINDEFVNHASVASILKKLHLDEESMFEIIYDDVENKNAK